MNPTMSKKTSDLRTYDELIQHCERLLKQNYTIYYEYVKQQEVLRLELLGTSTDYKYLRTWLDIAYEDILTSKPKHGTLTQHYEVLLKNNIVTKFLEYANDHETLQLKFIETKHQCNDIKTNLDASNECIKSLKLEYDDSCRHENGFSKHPKTLRLKLVESIDECERVKKSLDAAHRSIMMLNSELDGLTRRFRVLIRKNMVEEFLEYAKYQEKLELKYMEKTVVNECSKLCLDQANKEIASLNSKLTEIREIINQERSLSEKIDKQRNSLDYLSEELCCLLLKYQRLTASNDMKEQCSIIDEAMLKSANMNKTFESNTIKFDSFCIPEISILEVKIEKKDISCDNFEENKNGQTMIKEEKTDVNYLVNAELELPFSDDDDNTIFSNIKKSSIEKSPNSNKNIDMLSQDEILDHPESHERSVLESLGEHSNTRSLDHEDETMFTNSRCDIYTNFSNGEESFLEKSPNSNKKNDMFPQNEISNHSESPEPSVLESPDERFNNRIPDHEVETLSSSNTKEVVADSVTNLQTKQLISNLRCDIFCHDYPSMCEMKEYNCIACERLKLFKCNDCGQMFARKDAMQRHSSQVHEPGVDYYDCAYCDKRFIRKSGGLVYHIFTKHSEKFDKSYRCTTCGSSFAVKFLLTRHKNEKHDSVETLGKKIDKKEFDYNNFEENKNERTMMKERKTDVNQVGNTELKLPFPDKDDDSNLSNTNELSAEKSPNSNQKSDMLPRKEILNDSESPEPIQKSHVFQTSVLESPGEHSFDRISDHGEETMSTSNTTGVMLDSVGGSQMKQLVSNLRCDIFCRDYPSMCELKERNCIACERLKLFKCNDCGQMFAREDAMQHHTSQVHEPDVVYYDCAYCDKRCTSRRSFMCHIYTKHSEKFDKSYKCTICDASFVVKFLLTRHKNEKHDSVETSDLHCDICGRFFLRKSSLTRHKVSVHGKKRFACAECGKTFTTKSRLKVHFNVHSLEKPFECSTCGRRFKSHGSRRHHEKMVHTNCIPLVFCPHCNKHYRGKHYLSIHIHEQHFGRTSKSFKCATCDQSFHRKAHLKNHLSTHSSEKPFKCSICDSRFRHKGNKNDHERTVHNKELQFHCAHCDKRYSKKIALRNHIHGRHFSGLIKPFKCTICDSAFPVRVMLKNHVRVVHSSYQHLKCSYCDKYFKHDLYRKRHERSTHPPTISFYCLKCGKHYEDEKNLTRHMQRFHASELMKNPFKCPICNKKFASEITLEKHKSTHSEQNDARFNCAHCDKVCHRKNAIARHIQETHLPGIKMVFKCTICGKSFAAKRNLDRHQVVHITERSHKCSTCDKSFKSHESKRLHEIRSHGERADFICAYCGEKFRDKPSVSGHIERNHLSRNNKRFKCKVCRKSFPFKDYLRTHHQRMHTSRKSYKCSKCDKCYITLEGKRVHERRAHDGLRFNCRHCDKKYSRNANLLLHVRNHHS